jgi:hypothetical protein
MTVMEPGSEILKVDELVRIQTPPEKRPRRQTFKYPQVRLIIESPVVCRSGGTCPANDNIAWGGSFFSGEISSEPCDFDQVGRKRFGVSLSHRASSWRNCGWRWRRRPIGAVTSGSIAVTDPTRNRTTAPTPCTAAPGRSNGLARLRLHCGCPSIHVRSHLTSDSFTRRP